MKKSLFAVFVALLSLGLTIGNAEAARLGGGKSTGMQRQSVAPKPAAPTQAAPAAPAGTPATAPAAAPKRNWMGPLAGLAAGIGIAALLSHFGMGEGVANFLMIALLAMAAVFIVKMLFRRKDQTAPASEPLQYAAAGHMNMAPPAQTFGAAPSAAVESARRIPEGFDVDGFLRVGKLNFVRLQAANDTKDIADIREFVSPELFAEIKLQMDERGSAPQQTDVVTLNAELLEVVTEGQHHIASIRFSGMIREVAGAAAAPFDEIWNLTKQVDGSKGWTVSGIQQVN